eukprot:Em0021g53a
MQQVKVLPLAPKPLCCPYSYDDSYQVIVQLDEPLWVSVYASQEIAAEVMALCLQLDTLILSSSQKEEVDPRRKVSFEHAFSSKASSVLQQAKDALLRLKYKGSLEDYLRSTAIANLFPRVEQYLQETDPQLWQTPSSTMDDYFAHMAALNNLLTMAHQLKADVQTSSSHRYIAHQTALLHQCVTMVGGPLAEYKKDIEGAFKDLKVCCSTDESGHPPRLNSDLHKWLVNITQKLIDSSVSLSPPSLLLPLVPVLETLHHITH